jgi:purine-binding chemotaxis protein CheW
MEVLHRTPDLPVLELATPATAEEGERYLIISVASAEYGVPLEHLAGVERIGPVAVVPHGPLWLWGLTNIHGHVLPVADLAAFLGLGRVSRSSAARLIVARGEDEGYAFAVERTGRLIRIPPGGIRAAGSMLPGTLAGYFRGVWLHEERPALPLLDLWHVARSLDAWFRAEGWNDDGLATNS